jgi:hypothetical protein
MNGSYTQHQQLMIRTQLLLQEKIAGARLFPRVVGTFKFIKGDGFIEVGIPGQADAVCYFPVTIENFTFPLFAEIEFKTGNAKQQKNQKIWEKYISSLGGLYIVARNEHDTVNQVLTFRDSFIKKMGQL